MKGVFTDGFVQLWTHAVPLPLASVVSDEKSRRSELPFLVSVRCSSLATFKIFPLSLVFRSFIMVCLGADFFGLILFGVCLAS